MTNTEKQANKYEDMNNEEKAQVIYDTLLQEEPAMTLSELLMELSPEYPDEEIFTVEDWLDYVRDSDMSDLIKIVQESKGLNINDEYIRESIYYDGYKTSNNVLDLISRDEAIDWITNALNDDSSYYSKVIPTLI